VAVVPSSDPHAWLRPIFARLQASPAFGQSARAHQFAQLCDALSAEHPSEAEEMRHWSNATQNALLAHLASAVEEPPVLEQPPSIQFQQPPSMAQPPSIDEPPPIQDTSPQELSHVWRATKNHVEMHCVLQFLLTGTDVWLFEGDSVQRTQSCRDAVEAIALAEQWRKEMMGRGWKSE
jgi:hypothetical protein